jgi:hypothetical protein
MTVQSIMCEELSLLTGTILPFLFDDPWRLLDAAQPQP